MTDLSFPDLALMVIAACLLDRLFGEPTRLHPLIGFGRAASTLERRFNLQDINAASSRRRGLYCWLLLVIAPALAAEVLLNLLGKLPQILFGTTVLYLVIGGRSLQEHANQVITDLDSGNLSAARTHVSWLVSRDTTQLDETGISKACIESILENGNDALFAPVFWFCVLGPAGAILYRLANTLDAMWGYRTPRYLNFGWAPAKLDDLLNYIPARLTALSYAFVGQARNAMVCWRTQAPQWDSPNAGPVMASGAGALNLQLGGAANYHGATEARPTLGAGVVPCAWDIRRAQQLVRKALFIWIVPLFFVVLLEHIE